ncbi:hypothetical protein QTN25_000229 [Entamoeba marina]
MGSLFKLDQTIDSTLFVIFHKPIGLLIRGDLANKFTFNIFKNDKCINAQTKLMCNIHYTDQDKLYSFHHPSEFKIFIGIHGKSILYVVPYNVVFFNSDNRECSYDEMSSFSIFFEPIEEILFNGTIGNMFFINNMIISLISINNRVGYAIYDTHFNITQHIPFTHQNNKLSFFTKTIRINYY